MRTHPFIIYVILYLYDRSVFSLCSITCLCCGKRRCFGVPLHVLKLMSLILVKFNHALWGVIKVRFWLDWLDLIAKITQKLVPSGGPGHAHRYTDRPQLKPCGHWQRDPALPEATRMNLQHSTYSVQQINTCMTRISLYLTEHHTYDTLSEVIDWYGRTPKKERKQNTQKSERKNTAAHHLGLTLWEFSVL